MMCLLTGCPLRYRFYDMPESITDDLVNVAVPRRFYPLIIRTLASALSAEEAPAAAASSERPWTRDEIHQLKRLTADNATVRALLEITSASPGTRVTFQEVYERAGRTYGQARADLAGLTRISRQRFGRETWPVNVVQGSDKVLTYDAEPAVAQAWNDADQGSS
jgi:hypothetical protein